MTPDELQALRDKHKIHRVFTHVCDGCSNRYPCDTINVLDYLDNIMVMADIYGLAVEAATEIKMAKLYGVTNEP